MTQQSNPVRISMTITLFLVSENNRLRDNSCKLVPRTYPFENPENEIAPVGNLSAFAYSFFSASLQ